MKSRGANLVRLSLHLPFLQPLLLPLLLLAARTAGAGNGDIWPLERPEGMPAIQSLEVMCGKDHMDVHLSFTHPFEGIVSSKGQYADPRCVYVQPSTGKTAFQFRIAYARCGTKPDLHGQFYENTVVVQYDKDLLEVWDEAKRLRCEWFNDYEKTASKPPMVIADLDVIQLDFRGDNVDCWMEIQHGKGPWAPPVSGIVPLGSTLTLVVAINDYRGEFDMRVKSCAASDGGGHVIQLSDEHGCVLRPKMISRFLKARAADERASVITYAFFHAFKFPDALSVHIKCKVEICRHGCLDHCQLGGPPSHGGGGGHHVYGGPLERKDQGSSGSGGTATGGNVGAASQHDDMLIYDELSTDVAGAESVAGEGSAPAHFPVVVSSDDRVPASAQAHTQQRRPPQPSAHYGPLDFELHKDPLSRPFQDTLRPGHRDGQERFPHGPRHLDADDVPQVVGGSPGSEGTKETPSAGTPAAAAVSTSARTPAAGAAAPSPSPSPGAANAAPAGGNRNRRRRSVVVSDRKVRSADVGVSGLYEVISEVDLAFTPERAEAVTVFQGRIREEVVYGICLPVPGFSVLFVLVAVSAVVSALVAGSLLYRYQLQRDTLAAAQQQAAAAAAVVAAAAAAQQQQRHGRAAAAAAAGTSSAAAVSHSFAGWMAMRLLRARAPSAAVAASAPAASASALPSTSSAASAAAAAAAAAASQSAAAQGACNAQAQSTAVAAAAAVAAGNHCAAER